MSGEALGGGPKSGEALGASHLWKRFGEVVANRDVSLSVARGQIHALVGENGAGKSTLMRALYGMDPPDSGEVRLGGRAVARPSVAASLAHHVGMVHQHFMLVPTLTVVENVVLGAEGRRLDLAGAARRLAELSARFGLALDPGRRVAELSVGEAQRVEIVKVLWRGAETLILDEPTAVLTPGEVDHLFQVLRGLVAGGKTVLVVTHKLDEVMALSSQVTVLRRGEVVAQMATRETSAAELAQAMVGRAVVATADRPRAPVAAGAPVRLAVEDLAVARPDGSLAVDGVSLQVRAGEILGIAGVEGNGQTELTLALAGVLPLGRGRAAIDGVDLSRASVRARQRAGLAHIPEDRHARGLVLDFTVEDNVMVGRDQVYARPLSLDRQRLRADTRAILERLDVRPPDPSAPARALSGGNQQKVVVGRELSRRPRVLVCAQPTRGVDVGAIERIHEELLGVRAAGCAVLLLSAELDELTGLADRIAVLYRGRVVGTVDNPPERRAERQALGELMLGAGSGS
jgi:simple sugar transport system ATP-binding protein